MALALALGAAWLVPSAAQAKTLTVCKGGCSATNIQAAVNAAQAGDTVEVKSNGALGYTQQVTVAKHITLEGDPNGKPPVLKFASGSPTLAFSNAASGSTLKHMTVISSGAQNDALDFDQADGTISDVSATANGTAIDVASNGVTVGPSVSASGGLVSSAGAATITGVTVTGAPHEPNPVAGSIAAGTVTDSTFIGGSGQGLLLGSGATARRVVASGSVGIHALGGSVTDSLAVATQGDAVYAAGSVQLRNVTAITSGHDASGVIAAAAGTDVVARNVIARGGAGGSDVATAGGKLEIGYSNFTPSSSAGVDASTIGHNQSSDPLFVDGTVGPAQDFHLRPGSPAIGAGTSDAQTTTSDLDGSPRPAAGQTAPSIGAYEPTSDTLNVVVSGSGNGSVSGSGISCPGTCSHVYPAGTVVPLSAMPAAGSVFAGWSGACSETDSCQVTMSSEHTVTATFNLVPPANRALPVIGGTPALGQTLVASDGTWAGSPTSFAYQWQDCNPAGGSCSSIAGATDSVYKPVAGDVTHTLRIVVTASNAGGARSARSAPTATVTAPPPALSRVRLGSHAFRAHNGTTLKLTLSRAATLNVVITQTHAGRKVNGRCNPAARHGRRCTVSVPRAKLVFRGTRGTDSFRLLIKSLAFGRYTATITARTGGASSKPVKLNFTIQKR